MKVATTGRWLRAWVSGDDWGSSVGWVVGLSCILNKSPPDSGLGFVAQV